MTSRTPRASLTALQRLRWGLWRARTLGLRRAVQRLGRRATATSLASALLAGGCTLIGAPPAPPTATPSPTPPPTHTATPDPAWRSLAPGIELRTAFPPNSLLAQLTIVRLDPTQLTLRVHDSQGAPQTAEAWQAALPNAQLIINASFFDVDHNAIGLVIADGAATGRSLVNRGGTFAIDANGNPLVRSNILYPYAGEAYAQAAQGLPMLIADGAQAYTDTRPDRATRRTVYALDDQGRLLVMVTSFGGITLLSLAEWLATSDLGLVQALNMDGGGSSMLLLSGTRETFTMRSVDPVPVVLSATPRMPSP